MDTGGITPDTIKALQTINKSPNLLGMIGDIGRGGLSNLESLIRGGVAQVPGTAGDLETLGRMGINTSFGAGGVKVSPKAVMPTTSDILGMMPQRVTQSRPETAGMEELGTMIAPGLAKAAAPVGKGYLSLLGNEINAGMTGQPTRSVIGQMTPKPLQIFIGENAKTWDKEAAKTAVEMEKAGAKPEDIWSATGTFRGAEGKLRQEISDKYSTIKGGGSFEDVIMNAYDRGVERTRGTGQREYWQPYKTTVDDVLFHHNLSEAYPELMKIESQLTPNETGSKGQLMLTDKDLIMQIRPDLQGTQAESTMLHELQHGVQEKEGFAKGGSPDLMVLTLEKLAKQKREEAQKMFDLSSNKDPLNPQIIKPGARAKGLELEKEARLIQDQVSIAYHSEKAKYDLYKKLAGEAEARAVQSRMNMTDAERRAKFPYQSYDVPINDLIVRK
jgi:hypothetical protein